ncbi:DsbA family oxidoreductase [Cellulomonas sp. APG4]|uniref:DsbA family oxidoreductase n=1 Tax=Cellulomonas sp. APG4 TaxID=1538656 RepID=UPI00137B3E60|nr:DsbA family oxidoreductase [Cellulomonas sp. APG4]NCT92506.1 DsbA family oxidoreductase [Cellulomonas sp. APG4]
MSEPVSVHVWSDIACPWCFLGKRRFEKAVAATGVDVQVEYHSYQLAPETPVDFEGSELDFLVQHKGISADQVRQMHAQMTELGAGEGLRYDFATTVQTNTALAHQALHHAKAHGLQAELVERLFAAHFEEGRHVGRVDDLVELGEDVGLEGSALREALEEGRHADAVEQDVAAAHGLGVRGVPFYVLDERYGVSGAQSPEVFASALQRVLDDRTARVGAEG